MFVFDLGTPALVRSYVRRLLPLLPPLSGRPIRIQCRSGLHGSGGAIHAGSFLRERRIAFDRDLGRYPTEFARIFVHELAHFAWLRLGNPLRRSYESLILGELARGARGELGWSAEWRKAALSPADRPDRTRRWREYVCESFCDSAAWRFAGLRRHPEFTLSDRWCRRRAQWFDRFFVTKRISI